MNKVSCLASFYILFSAFVSPLRAMVINITYDASVTNLGYSTLAPPAVASAVQWFQTQYTNPITINIRLAFSPGVGLGQSSFDVFNITYAELTDALASHRSSAADFSSVASIPATDPTGGSTWYVTRPQYKVLGLPGMDPNDLANDGTVTFASTVSYTFDPNNRSVPGKYDFIGAFEHEVSEVMGRVYLLKYRVGGYSAYDLFRFSSNGVRSFSTAANNAYFSVDNGATPLKYFYTDIAGDLQDWTPSSPPDSYDAAASAGSELIISSADILALDILGYNIPAAPTSEIATVLLTGTKLSNGFFRLSFNGNSNENYNIMVSADLNSGVWTTIGSATEISPGTYQFTDSQTATQQQRFYRVRSP